MRNFFEEDSESAEEVEEVEDFQAAEEEELAIEENSEDSEDAESSTDESVEFEATAIYNEIFDDIVVKEAISMSFDPMVVQYVVDLRIEENNEIRIGGSYPPVNFRDIVVRRPKRFIEPFKILQ